MASARRGPPEDTPRNDPKCPDCPEGTRLLGKYEFEGGEFAFEKGACEDSLLDIEYTNKEGEQNEPIEVNFTSPVFAHDVAVKRGRDCTFASADDDVEFIVSTDKDRDGFEHTITVPEDGNAISHFNVCAGICYQADFVTGDVIEKFGDGGGGFYGAARRIGVRWAGTTGETGVNSINSSFVTDGYKIVVPNNEIEFLNDDTQARVSFEIHSVGEHTNEYVKLTLASYSATCPPYFSDKTAYIQDLVDYKTETFWVGSNGNGVTSANGGSYLASGTFTIDLPGLEWLDDLCDI